jgi:hypothetical protein
MNKKILCLCVTARPTDLLSLISFSLCVNLLTFHLNYALSFLINRPRLPWNSPHRQWNALTHADNGLL